jgi:iron complex outermembrane receptor protein
MKSLHRACGRRLVTFVFFLASVAQHTLALAQSEDVHSLPEVVVTGEGPALSGVPPGAPLATELAPTAPEVKGRAADSGALLQDVPGAAVVRNGPQTSILQLRGLSGDRVKVSVDGMTVTPACPNHMDPPLHYVAPSRVDAMTVIAGFTPVSLGGDSIGGTVFVRPLPLPFADSEKTLWFGDVGSVYRSSNDAWGWNGRAGAASQGVSVAYEGSRETGNNLRFPDGRVRDSGYDTQQHTLRSAVKTSSGVWGFDTGILQTRNTGTPALTMDMIQDDGYRIGLDYDNTLRFGTLEGRLYYHTIDHLMDNYSRRPLGMGMMPMFSKAKSDDVGLNLDAAIPRGRHTFRVGADVHFNKLNAYQQSMMSGVQQDTFNDARRARVGTYGEWQADWNAHWMTLLGARNDTVISDASDIDRWNPMGSAGGDAAAFNSQGHRFVDPDFDATAAVRWTPSSYGAYEVGFARKTRAPSLLERYLWTPLSASAGLADGRTYIGNLDLDPETSYQVSITADWHGANWQLKTTPFYNYVDDYIQGVPIPYNDTTVLQFQNLDEAELYGVDASGRYDFGAYVSLRTTLSYVRGRDLDHHDNLYRIAPLHGTVALEHRIAGLESEIELVWADSQKKVADYNDEPTTSGYTVVHLRTGYTFRGHLSLFTGIENVFDEKYSDHLGGINRVLDSDVAVGERLPGAGRFVYVGLRYEL